MTDRALHHKYRNSLFTSNLWQIRQLNSGSVLVQTAIDISIVAIVRAAESGFEVFLTVRGPNAHLPGTLELPGGKVESGESPIVAAIRELAEEVDLHLEPHALTPLAVTEHAYSDRSVRLHAFVMHLDPHTSGPRHPRGDWFRVDALPEGDLPAANRPITAALRAFLAKPKPST